MCVVEVVELFVESRYLAMCVFTLEKGGRPPLVNSVNTSL